MNGMHKVTSTRLPYGLNVSRNVTVYMYQPVAAVTVPPWADLRAMKKTETCMYVK